MTSMNGRVPSKEILRCVDSDSDDEEDLFVQKTKKLPSAARNESTISDDSELMFLDDSGSSVRDVDVIVDNPEKVVKTMETYVTYEVKTRTTRSDFEEPEYCVRRRYGEFEWLRNQLSEKYPFAIIPPLADRHQLTLEWFESTLIQYRQVALSRFINRVALHRILSRDETLRLFLTLPAEELRSLVKAAPGMFSRLTHSVLTKGSSMMLRQRPAESTAVQEYTSSLADRTRTLSRIAERLHTEHGDYTNSLSDLQSALSDWSKSDVELEPAVGATADVISNLHKQHSLILESTPHDLLLPMKELSMYPYSIKTALENRDSVQHMLEVVTEDLSKLEASRDGLDHHTKGKERAQLDKINTKISELNTAKKRCKQDLDDMTQKFRSEFQRWQRTKKADLKELVGCMADRHINTYDRHISSLETTLAQLKLLKNSL